jgi:hypothetical protein
MALLLPCTGVASSTIKVTIPSIPRLVHLHSFIHMANLMTEILESFRVEDFDIEYDSPNRFRFMGNGTTQREVRMEDLAYYVK